MNSMACARCEEHSDAYLSVWTLHNVNQTVCQFELFIDVFGRCWYVYCGQTLLSVKVHCCNDQLIPQLH